MTLTTSGTLTTRSTGRRARSGRTVPGAARLRSHLSVLEAERERHARARFDTGGDIGDRAWRMEGETRLLQLDAQIRRLRRSLDELTVPSAVHAGDRVALGVSVRLRFLGDSAEDTYVVGGVGVQDHDVTVLTPDSPLGKVLLGAQVGDTVQYASPRGREEVSVVAVG